MPPYKFLLLLLAGAQHCTGQTYTPSTSGSTSARPISVTTSPGVVSNATSISSSTSTSTSTTSTSPWTGTTISLGPYPTKKDKSVALLESLASGNTNAPALQFVNRTNYVEHNQINAPGFAGIQQFIALVRDQYPGSHITPVRVFQDGDIVFTHSDEFIFGGPLVVMSVFRFEGDLIVEHWVNFQAKTGSNPSGHTMVDGPTQSMDLDQTAANRQLITDFFNKVLIPNNFQSFTDYFDGNNFIRHDPNLSDGLGGGVLPGAVYTFLFKVFAEGNFVVSMSQGTLNGTKTAFYDLWRVSECGKIAESWSTVQTILPDDQAANKNGKFVCPGPCQA